MIVSETFYQARCDADGCKSVFPTDDDEGASHYPLDALREGLAEERGEHDETWSVSEDNPERTYCPRHKPGNIDCTTCGNEGWVKTNPEGKTFAEIGWLECARCGGRGYLTPTST